MPTDDLVKRLRERADAFERGTLPVAGGLMREAADEIELLRKPAGGPARGPRLTAGDMARLDDGRG
jgi:hypothetical protein